MSARDRLFRFALCRKRRLRLFEARTVGGLRRTATLWQVLERVGRGKLSMGLENVDSGKLFARRRRYFRSKACPESLNRIELGNPVWVSDPTAS